MARPDGVWVRLARPIAGIAVVYLYGIVGYMLFGFRAIDALYMTSLALTTAGFNPVGQLTPGEKAFTVSIAVFGVTLFLVILAIVTSALAAGDIGIATRRRRMERQVDRLRDHFIICAYGRVGRAAAREFEAEGVPFVVVDRTADVEEQMRSDGVVYLVADPTSEAALRTAGVERARGLLCAVDSDADNVYIALTARSMNPDIFVVARASDPRSPERLYRAGADRVISPYVSSGRHMAHLALRPRVVDYLEIAGRDRDVARLEEMRIDDGSPFVGASVSELRSFGAPLVLRRADGSIVSPPHGDELLGSGDLVVVLGANDGGGERS